MRNERETRAFRRLQVDQARAELKLARLQKRLRSQTTRDGFRLGRLGARFRWDRLDEEDMRRRAEAVGRLVADASLHAALAERAASIGTAPEADHGDDAPRSGTAFASADDVRASRRRLIALGTLMIENGLADADSAIVLGAMATVEEHEHPPGSS